MNFRYRLMQFLRGRYGVDSLFYVLFAISLGLSLLNCFLRLWVIQIAVYAITFYAIFRMFSRNVSARAKENRVVTGLIFKIKSNMETKKRRKADLTHIYKKCPNCKAILRLPRRKGKHKTICPKCSHKFSVRVYKEI